MFERNGTRVTEFLLVGFGNLHNFRILVFFLFLTINMMSLLGNFSVILLIAAHRSLHSAMYFFLSQMSLSDILFTVTITPNILRLILMEGAHMSVTGCMIQFYFLGIPTVAQCLLLAAMSYDRYVAICKPLHYTNTMTFTLQLRIVAICWFLGCLLVSVIYIFLTRLEFCDSNVIDYFYCDVAPVADISCSDTTAVEMVTSLTSTPLVLSPFSFIIGTYIAIVVAILKIPSSSGRQKAFSTCSSHLTVVCMYYGTLAVNYTFPREERTAYINKALSLMYMVVTPFFNPIVYSLRNGDIRRAVENSFCTCKIFLGCYVTH